MPSIAGPKRPQDRVPLAEAKEAFLEAMEEFDPEAAEQLGNGVDEAGDESFPASDPPAEDHDDERGKPRPAVTRRGRGDAGARQRGRDRGHARGRHDGRARPRPGRDRRDHQLHQHLQPERDGRRRPARPQRGANAASTRKPWVKTSLAPGSTVVTDYLDKAGLTKYLDQLQFNLVGYGCTTCIGNSGPLPPEISAAVEEKDLAVCAVLSGNRNFEGRINQDVKANYLASPPLVVAYALAGRMDLDLTSEPLGEGSDGEPVYLRDVWPDAAEIKELVGRSIASEMFTRNYGEVLRGRRDLERGRGARGRPLHLARLDLRAPALLLRGDAGRGAGRRADRRAPGCWRCSATRSPPTTSRRPGRSRRTARRAAGWSSRASSRATSTPTARGAATTR